MPNEKTKSKPKRPAKKKAGGDCSSAPCSVSLEFRVESGGKVYEGTVSVPDYDETCTLPMMINALMVNLARDCPQLHQGTEMTFVARLIPGQNVES